MSSNYTNTNWYNKIGSSIFHVCLYIALMTLISVAATAQDCDGISLACNNDLNISTDDECRAKICLDLILENDLPGFDDDDFSLTMTDLNDNPISTTLEDGCLVITEVLAGSTVKVSVSLDPCGISCWGFINIEDKVGPRFIECTNGLPYGFGETELDCSDYIAPEDVVRPDLAGDCNANIVPYFRDDTTDVSCVGIYTAHIIRTWIAADETGNETVCKQKINIKKFDISQVVFPPDFILDTDRDCDVIAGTDPASIEAHTPGSGFPSGISCPNIMYVYNDIIADTCGIQVKMLRDWVVIDWCNGATRNDGQVIKILDLDGPVVVCGNDFGLEMNFDTLFYAAVEGNCRADIILDPFSIIDSSSTPRLVEDCSGVILDQVAYLPAIPGSDQPTVGPYRPLEMGADSLFRIPESIEEIVWARYCYIDECGNGGHIDNEGSALAFSPADNTNCCFFEIRVSHDLPPTPICEGFTKIQLDGGDETAVPAITFDDHSFDLCGGDVSFTATRDGSCVSTDRIRGSYIHFCCNDIGKDIEVTLYVEDEEGNESSCRGIANVMNMGTTTITCPPNNVTIECDEDYRDEDLTGFATSGNSCANGNKTGFSTYDLSDFNVSCNIGRIYRSILVVNASGDTSKVCTQTIIVEATDSSTFLEEGDFTFPRDTTLDVCSAITTHPDHTGYPVTDKTFGCIDIGITYDDSNPITSNNNGLCYTILRTWKVVDWCRYDPAYPNRYVLKGSQEIRIRNGVSPTIECPDTMIMVSTDTLDCRAHVDLNVIVNDACQSGTDITWEIDGHTDNTTDQSGTGASASGIYPVGEHLATFTAINECGGPATSCEIPFVVKGDRVPLPICLASITWTINQNGEAIVWASDFDLKSEGGCDGTDSLTFSFVAPTDADYPQTSKTFTCADIPNGITNQITLEIHIVDESGNHVSCTVILFLQDSNDVCTDESNITSVGGQIHTEDNQMIENVMVQLENMSKEEESMDMTSSKGSYAFNDVAFYDHYNIDPEYDVDPLNGVSTLDLVMIQRHILGIEPLSSPYKMIAADINKDNNINGLDLVELRKLILGVIVDFPQNESWVFVPEKYEFADPYQPFGYEETINIEELWTSDMEADFIGVKVGDVNNSTEVNSLGTTITERGNNNLYLSGLAQDFKAGDLVAIPFKTESANAFTGLQMTMNFDHEKLNFQGIDGGSIMVTDLNFALLNSEEGRLTFSYSQSLPQNLEEGENLFTVYFEAKTELNTADVFSVGSEILTSEIYDESQNIRGIEYVFRDEYKQASDQIELFQNKPNPFSGNTVIAFSIPEAQEVTLSIFNAAGTKVWQEEGLFNKGINEFQLNSDQLNSSGILIYRLQSGKTSITKKMIQVR